MNICPGHLVTGMLGGLREVIAHPDMRASKYSLREGQEEKQYAGIPFPREELESRGARFKLAKEQFRISEHVITTGEIPLLTEFEEVEPKLFERTGSEFHRDPLADDLALVIDAEFGLVVILGCAHRGIINTLRHAQKITGKELIYAAIGGTHLFRASDGQIEPTIADIKEKGYRNLEYPIALASGHQQGSPRNLKKPFS